MHGSGKRSTINILLGREECKTEQTFMKGGLTKKKINNTIPVREST